MIYIILLGLALGVIVFINKFEAMENRMEKRFDSLMDRLERIELKLLNPTESETPSNYELGSFLKLVKKENDIKNTTDEDLR